MTQKKSQIKEGLKRINVDVPEYVHDFLSSLHGNKKVNAELILINEAKKKGFKDE